MNPPHFPSVSFPDLIVSVARSGPYRRPALIRNLGLDELRQKRERLLPAETARLEWNDRRQTLLHDIQLGSARDPFQGHRRLHLARQVRIVESVRVANTLVWHQFEKFPA